MVYHTPEGINITTPSVRNESEVAGAPEGLLIIGVDIGILLEGIFLAEREPAPHPKHPPPQTRQNLTGNITGPHRQSRAML
jgi:hypothetical protein